VSSSPDFGVFSCGLGAPASQLPAHPRWARRLAPHTAHSSYDDDLKKNADGSIDLYFGPQAPSGGESNWLETVPGSGFYPMFRFYTPTAPLFDGTWSLPDIELT
jgi:Protein of unknown function (DUF1214)